MTKILVVDDSRLHRAMIAAVLKEEGYETIEAKDGFDSLAKVALENPDLIVLDRVMPSMDGVEVCRRLKADAFTQHIPILMLTILDSRFESSVSCVNLRRDLRHSITLYHLSAGIFIDSPVISDLSQS